MLFKQCHKAPMTGNGLYHLLLGDSTAHSINGIILLGNLLTRVTVYSINREKSGFGMLLKFVFIRFHFRKSPLLYFCVDSVSSFCWEVHMETSMKYLQGREGSNWITPHWEIVLRWSGSKATRQKQDNILIKKVIWGEVMGKLWWLMVKNG